MGNQPNLNDLRTISDGVIDGDVKLSELPDIVQQDLVSMWTGQSEPEFGPDSKTVEALMQERDARVQDSILDSPLFKPIEWVGSKLYWAYSQTVSPAASTAAMVVRSAIHGRPDYIGQDGELDALGDYWRLAHSVSPGQAIWQLGLDNDELKARGITPDQMAQDKKLVAEGKVSAGQTRSDLYYGSGAAKWVTGTADLAVSWWADPLVLAGKGLGAAKTAVSTKPVVFQVERAQKALKRQGITQRGAEFDLVASTPVFQNMVDKVFEIKAANPDSAALVLRRDFKTIRDSANGDSLARLLAGARNKDEVAQILRVSMGDRAAQLSLDVDNVLLANQIEELNSSFSALSTSYLTMSDARKATPYGQLVKKILDRKNAKVAAMDNQYRIVSEKIKAFNTVDNMNFNSVTTPLGLKVRGSKVMNESPFMRKSELDQSNIAVRSIKAAGRLVYNTSIGTPVFLIRSYNDIRPTAYIDIHHEDSYKNVAALLGESKAVDRALRERMVSDYIKASPADRPLLLQKMEQETVNAIVNRYNARRVRQGKSEIDRNVARELYADMAARRSSAQRSVGQGRAYGTAKIDDPSNPGTPINVAYVDEVGGTHVTTPLFETQLANSHVMMDFNLFEKILNEQGSNFQKLRESFGAGARWTTRAADQLNSYWKFAQLFRLGYTPRAIADDYLGQLARFGFVPALARAVEGGKVKADDFFRMRWGSGGVEFARTRQALLDDQLEELSKWQRDSFEALARETAKSGPDVQLYKDLFDDSVRDIEILNLERAEVSKIVARGAGQRGFTVGERMSFEGPYQGVQGALFMDLASGQRSMANMLGSEADMALKRMRREDWGVVTPLERGPEYHMDAWMRVINQQLAHSSIGREALKGADEAQLVHWMRTTPEGRDYVANVKPKGRSEYDQALRVKAQVDEYLDPTIPGMDAVRSAALNGTLTREMLEFVPVGARPDVIAQKWGYASGESTIAHQVDKIMDGYFRLAATIPSQRLIRNPLYNQQYKANLNLAYRKLAAQGQHSVDEATRVILQENARKAALRDVKRYSFTMDQETRMAFALRHFGAFFGAQQESWNRWARIISEKPQALAHVAQVYGAPSRVGITVDQDGNVIDGAGYVTDYETGEKRLTKIGERKMLIQIPEYLGGKALNKMLGRDENASFTTPLSSAELVLNTGDGVLPVGVGPMVQIAANDLPFTDFFDANGNPKVADWAKKLGVLPFGPQESVMDFVLPTTGKRLKDWFFEDSDARQRDMFYMMQVEHHKWMEGLRDTEPTWQELQDRAGRWSIARAAFAFALPLSVNGEDPYQFFRDEYQRYQKLDADSADQKFYDKYGDSFYMFSQSMSRNNTGLRPTAEAVQMSKYYQDLIDKVGPEYAGLIVGSEGEGKYSNGAYFYQKTHSAGAGVLEKQRDTMGAREAWSEARAALGWKQYSATMNGLYSELFSMGLTSFEDEGAEELKLVRDGLVDSLTQEETVSGQPNKFYNPAWAKEQGTLDKTKYDRRAADIWKIVNDPELQMKAMSPDGTMGVRSDIARMYQYLEQRRNFRKALLIREDEGGSADPLAQSNEDIKDQWDQFVLGLIQSDTKFGWAHTRWFSGDMGFNARREEYGGDVAIG